MSFYTCSLFELQKQPLTARLEINQNVSGSPGSLGAPGEVRRTYTGLNIVLDRHGWYLTKICLFSPHINLTDAVFALQTGGFQFHTNVLILSQNN